MPNHSLAWHRHHRRRRTERWEAIRPWLPDIILVGALAGSILIWMLALLS
jgi:hypothetical protein